MANKPLCFISYEQIDEKFIYLNIIPILKESKINFLVANEQRNPVSRNQIITDGIRQSDIVICLLNSTNINTILNFEIGVALGNNKPIVVIITKYDGGDYSWFFTDFFYLLFYSENDLKGFSNNLRHAIGQIAGAVIDKAVFNSYPDKKIIGLKVGMDSDDFAEQLSFTSAFIDFIKYITDDPAINLLQTSKGSLKSLISLDLKSWAELVEKIIFFIPELKKRKQDRLKIEAGIRKTDAETNQINVNTKIRQAEAFLDIAERYQKLGFTIQIDNDLLILQSQNGQLTFKQPPRIE